jgi:hypothetical protein
MLEELREVNEMIEYLYSIKNQILSKLGVVELGGWTEEEFEIASKAYAEAEKNFKFIA